METGPDLGVIVVEDDIAGLHLRESLPAPTASVRCAQEAAVHLLRARDRLVDLKDAVSGHDLGRRRLVRDCAKPLSRFGDQAAGGDVGIDVVVNGPATCANDLVAHANVAQLDVSHRAKLHN